MPVLAAAILIGSALPTIETFLKDKESEAREGLLTTHISAPLGKVYLELPPAGDKGLIKEVIVVSAITTGLGANSVGLDRGKLMGTTFVQIRRSGPKVQFYIPNLRYRSLTSDEASVKAARESFADSVMWAGPIAAQDEDGSILIDLTPLVLQDQSSLARTLGGSYRIDAMRSGLEAADCFSFPKNLEFEALVTMTGSGAGRDAGQAAADSTAISFRQHLSIVDLPEPGYSPRPFDPRIGFFSFGFMNLSNPLDTRMDVQWARRHRLEKPEATNQPSQPIEPLIYYVDRGAPEDIRKALIEGASWWNQAFEAAGFIDGFQVKEMPEGAHPLDVRYNVIQWVHRSTRGWSYGSSVTDPRTGEILKGHVSLGSQRVHQDKLIFEGLFGADATGKGGDNDPRELALARLRQLSAHEVGHTLGLAHNFAASTNNRASVMDYPAPKLSVVDGEISAEDAYAVGIGDWDKAAIRWGYSMLPDAALPTLATRPYQQGLIYLSDGDSRSPGSADPRGSLWDNGANAVSGLRSTMAVRELAMAGFGTHCLAEGMPKSRLHEVFVPVYLHHRFQVEAAVKTLGGIRYQARLKGDKLPDAEVISPAEQDAALALLLDCLSPTFLEIPDAILKELTPPAFGGPASHEQFGGATGPVFDPYSAAGSAVQVVLSGLLNSTRLARMELQNSRNPLLPSSKDVIDQLYERAFEGSNGRRAVRVVVQQELINSLMRLAQNGSATSTVRSRAAGGLRRIRSGLNFTDEQRLMADDIDRFLNRPAGSAYALPPTPDVPPGSPIGCSHG